MKDLKDLFIKREALRDERLDIESDESKTYFAIASIEEHVEDVMRDEDVYDEFIVIIKTTNQYLEEGVGKLKEIISSEEIPEGISIGEAEFLVDVSPDDEPISSLEIRVNCDLDHLNEKYECFVEFLKEKATTHFARLFKDLEDKEAAAL